MAWRLLRHQEIKCKTKEVYVSAMEECQHWKDYLNFWTYRRRPK